MTIVSAKQSDTVKALTTTVREATDTYNNDLTTDHYYYYGNGAIRSINNLAGSTYNFTESDFEKDVQSLTSKYLSDVNYDDTSKLWIKAGSDNLSKLNTIMKMPSKKTQWLTNYTDAELKERNLIPDNDTDSSDDNSYAESITEANTIDNGEATTSDLVAAASYLVNKDYYTVPQNLKVEKTEALAPVKATLSLAENHWYYASRSYETWDASEKQNVTVTQSNNLLKSDLIMILSKIYKGIQPSSALVFSDYSERDGKVWSTESLSKTVTKDSGYSVCLNNNDKSARDYYGSTHNVYGHTENGIDIDGTDYHGAQFVGDYWVYYDPNVYELYLSEALNDGIISLSDLDSDSSNDCSKFRADYKSRKTGNWGNGKFRVNSQIKNGSLGYSKKVANGSKGLTVLSKKPTYFGDKENMTMMEALRLIESYMRANDENMSKTEERIVRYKLGLNVLSYLDTDDCSTVTYLIAKGILDGNSTSLASALYDDATVAKILPLLYRVANKEARCDFGTIQLTDSETFWASEGFSSDNFSILNPSNSIIHETDSITEEVSRRDNTKDDGEELTATLSPERNSKTLLGNIFGSRTANAASTTQSNVKTYKIVKVFDRDSVYRIGSTTIAKLKTNKDKSEWKKYNITAIDSTDDYEYGGKKHKVYKVTFEVTATKRSTAIASVDKQITVMSDLDQKKKTLTGVTNVTTNGKTTSLVSQTSLKQSFSNITVLEDKVLMNNVTGTMAYFSYDSKISLVGSQVISSGYSCISKVGNEVYYNLDAVITLLSSAYLDVIGPQISIVTTDVEHTKSVPISTTLTDAKDYLMNAQYMKMYVNDTSGEANDFSKGYLCIATKDSENKISSNNRDIAYFLKLNTLSTAANELTRSFNVDYNGTKVSGTVIINLQYIVPDVTNFSKWFNSQLVPSGKFTYQEASQILMTAPDKLSQLKGFTSLSNSLADADKSALNAWWYSNYGMSNALCNWLYDTSGKVYVPTGYVCPSVTILVDKVGSKTFSKWCSTRKNRSGSVIRDAVLSQIFDGFSLGKEYAQYNGGSSDKFWHYYYQCDASVPDYTSVGFKSGSKEVTNTIAGARTFSIVEQPASANLKNRKMYKISADQGLKTYGTQYAVSATGSVFERVDALGSSKQPMFSVTTNYKNGVPTTIKTLKLNSRTAKQTLPSRGQLVTVSDNVLRYDSRYSSNKTSYYALYNNQAIHNGKPTSDCYKLQLSRNLSSTNYNVMYLKQSKNTQKVLPLNSTDFFEDSYKVAYSTTFGQYATCPATSDLQSMMKSKSSNVFLDPSTVGNKSVLLKTLFGSGTAYIYTDKGTTDGLEAAGKIYKWNGSTLTRIKSSASIINLASKRVSLYAVPLYYVPCDTFFFSLNSAKEMCLGSNPINKSLNYLQYDLTSLNNQLIDAYLQEQQGVKRVTDLENGTELRVGDTVWTKKGDWWQSKPISDSSNVKTAISKHKNMMWYSNKLFSGLYLSVSGKQYSLQGYVDAMQMGSLVGSKSQVKKGVVFVKQNTVKVKKGSKVSNATSKTKAQYISIKCKFKKDLLARPIDSSGLKYTYLEHSGTGLISSADYPFFDEEASWDRTKTSLFNISSTSFKPSSAFEAAKKEFMSEFHAMLAEDSWNFIWMLIIMLASYLMIMSWFAYGVITLGVGRSGFEALQLKDRSGTKKGIDLIKIATFGLYSIEQEVSLARMVIVSLGCCTVILTILIVVF